MAKQLKGTVVSTKMNNTITVAVERRFSHPIYKKSIRRTKRYKVHTENASLKEGNTVLIEETRPISSNKRHRLLKVITKD